MIEYFENCVGRNFIFVIELLKKKTTAKLIILIIEENDVNEVLKNFPISTQNSSKRR